MIVVTGASGALGRLIVEELLKRLPAEKVAASVRDPKKADDLSRRGVQVRHGDFAQPATLPAAFEDAEQLLIVSSNAAAFGGDPLAQHRAAIDAAREAGVRRIVYTSHMAASRTSAFKPMSDHAATETMLQEAGVAWTALRNGFYANAVPRLIGDARTSGKIVAPEDGKVSWTAHSDLAAAAAAVLVEEGRFDGPTPPLTNDRALDLADIADILSDLDGKPISRVRISDEELAQGMAARGVPPVAIGITQGLYRAARNGEFAATDPAMADLIGRSPLPLRDVFRS